MVISSPARCAVEATATYCGGLLSAKHARAPLDRDGSRVVVAALAVARYHGRSSALTSLARLPMRRHGPSRARHQDRQALSQKACMGRILAKIILDYAEACFERSPIRKNPILQPWAAAVVKKFGEMSLAGITYGNPSNQCWPEPVPFIYKQLRVQIIQQPDTITFLYSDNMDVRRVHLNQGHQEPLTPALYGDSAGHYEGDTLVIDTVAVRTDRPYAMIDLFGTPYTKSLHVVERYRLREYDDVKDALERHKKENWLPTGDIYSGHRGKFLQLHLTIEDEGVFTTPWTATITYVPGPDTWSEVVCAENTHQYYYNNEADVPRAEKPDF
jgi:hypothetical protein